MCQQVLYCNNDINECGSKSSIFFDKNLLFNGMSIREGKDTVKKKNRTKDKGTMGFFGKKGLLGS